MYHNGFVWKANLNFDANTLIYRFEFCTNKVNIRILRIV